MTAAEFLTQQYEKAFTSFQDNVESLQIFSRMKVKEALEIAAEKAKVKIKPEGLDSRIEGKYESYSQGGHGEPQWCTTITADQDSILNAINLDEFIQ